MFAVELKDDVYRRRVIFAVGPLKDLKEMLNRTYGKHAARELPNDAVGFYGSFKHEHPDYPEMGRKYQIFIIWLLRFDNTPRGIATLVHECYHCAVAILDDLGVPSSDETTQGGPEQVAYFLDSIVEKALTALGGRNESP